MERSNTHTLRYTIVALHARLEGPVETGVLNQSCVLTLRSSSSHLTAVLLLFSRLFGNL